LVIDSDAHFDALLRYLREARGFDFTGYKRSSVMRRVDRRMQEVRVGEYDDYLDYLQVHTDEFTPLFNTILINVTSFFRDPDAWEQMRAQVVPDLLARKGDEPIRVWSAGCAAGQEAYSLAMVLADAMGLDDFRQRVKIYATDVDEDALTQARTASYAEREIEGLSPESLEHRFERGSDGRFTFTKDLRRSVIFGRNDLVQDAPISRIDLLACRNTLMYFNAETQARMLQRLHFALMPGGVLFLGKAETLLTQGGLFTPVDAKRRFFRKVAMSQANPRDAFADLRHTEAQETDQDYGRLRTEALLAGPVPQVLIDAEGRLAVRNLAAQQLFGVTERDVGRPFQDLEMSFRPAELRSAMLQASKERRVHWVRGIEWLRADESQTHLDVQISPLIEADGTALGFSLVFLDVSRLHQLQEDLEYANRQLETAYEELQSSNEELETTNEELQSTVEELETTNEELQSTNEELETMNQELQAMNDELQSSTTAELGHTAAVKGRNAFVEAILGSLDAGIVVVSADLRVQVWSSGAYEQWGIRADEAIGSLLTSLDVGLPVPEVEALVKGVLADGVRAAAETEVDAVNRRGRPVHVRIRATALAGTEMLEGVVLILDTQPGRPPGR
jgi:two-component system CheB/CheR fusion protein